MGRFVIRAANGRPISKSRNLRGIRTRASKVAIASIDFARIRRTEGKFRVTYEDGAYANITFASFQVMAGFLARWRNAELATFTCEGKPLVGDWRLKMPFSLCLSAGHGQNSKRSSSHPVSTSRNKRLRSQ